jgi:hypothetical protein
MQLGRDDSAGLMGTREFLMIVIFGQPQIEWGISSGFHPCHLPLKEKTEVPLADRTLSWTCPRWLDSCIIEFCSPIGIE